MPQRTARCAYERTVGSLQLSWTEYAGGSRMPTHAHRNPRFVFVLDGRFAETCDGRPRTCEPRTLLIRPPGEAHSEDFCYGDAACLSIELPPSWIDGPAAATASLARSVQLRGMGIARITAKLRREMQHADTASALAIEAAVLDALVESMRSGHGAAEKPRELAWLARVVEILHARFTEPLLLSQVAAEAGIHPVHLARTFRRRYGTSVGEYLRNLRIEHARQALRTSDAPLAQIAAQAGFADQSHFSNAFKRATGRTPGEFRAAFGRR